jgi:hypothetical protein
MILSTGLRVTEKYFNPQPVMIKAEPTKTVEISMPKPSKGYFVECMNDDLALVIHKETWYYCECDKGKWVYREIQNDQDYSDFKLPKPQEYDTGTL